ncbi:hypothetical protein AB4Z48_03020 [Cupriavidus sp. 2TAF22]|uniref:hypothetical protein n=1 Tax=unclassified Cupriavidus TaxID=2640874 RepID=UPI003F8EF8DF
MKALYRQSEVELVLAAYRDIFPSINEPLAKYWGLGRERPWSYVTTDFHRATYEQLRHLHDRTQAIDAMALATDAKGAALRDASIACGVGFSMGICPWTDNLLLNTYSPDKDSLTILLGHDWYPIVVESRNRSDSPMRNGDALHYTPKYMPAAPQAIFDGSTVGLFLNLYPDYRPPGDGKCGSLRNYGISYEECLDGLDSIIAAVSKRFKTVRMISWGANVWTALRARVRGVSPLALMAHAQAMSGEILAFESSGKEIQYLPIAHPSHPGNFYRAAHLMHIRRGFGAMGLGLPASQQSARIA